MVSLSPGVMRRQMQCYTSRPYRRPVCAGLVWRVRAKSKRHEPTDRIGTGQWFGRPVLHVGPMRISGDPPGIDPV